MVVVVFTHWWVIAERGGCFQWRLFVRLFVCLFVCQHDNFQTIRCRMMKLSGYVHCTKISPKFECQGQRSPGTKNKKCGILFGSHCLGHGPCVAFFSVTVLACVALPVGNSVCRLVFISVCQLYYLLIL